MIGRLDPHSKNVTVVGAGISGLLCAYYLDRAGYQVRLLDASEREGGLISTRATELGMVESAAHSFPATPTITELCADLGVELCPLRPGAKARWIFRRGKPRRFPLNPFEMLAALFRAYFVLAPARDPESLTVEEWTRRFLGDQALQYLMTPFTRGIYGASPSELSVSAAFPSLCVPRGHSLLSFLLAKKWRKAPISGVRRSVPKIPGGSIVAPRDGMQGLISALGKRLEERLGARFQRGFRVDHFADLDGLIGRDNVILCVPAKEAARLLAQEAPQLASELDRVRYSSLTTATVFLKNHSFTRKPRGLGVLVPQKAGRGCLGILYNSSAFPGRVTREDLVSLTMMFESCAPELDELVRSELRAILGVKDQPLAIHARHWERAIPKYDAHLLKTWECAERTWCSKPGRVLFGNYAGQVSIRGMAELARTLAKPISLRTG